MTLECIALLAYSIPDPNHAVAAARHRPAAIGANATAPTPLSCPANMHTRVPDARSHNPASRRRHRPGHARRQARSRAR